MTSDRYYTSSPRVSLRDTSILGISEAATDRATIYDPAYRTFSTPATQTRPCTYVHSRRGAVITASLMDGTRRARIRNTASISFVFV